MKALKIMMLFILMGFAGSAFSQTVSSTPTHKLKNPAHHAVHQRIRQEIRHIQMDERSGKITAAQAQALKAKLKGVHDQQKNFYQQNKGGDLTTTQAQQLNQLLDGIAASH
jgi:hypothetical protein